MSESDLSTIKKAITRAAGALLMVLILQIGSLLWWGGQMSARMGHAEEGLSDVTQRVHALEIDTHD